MRKRMRRVGLTLVELLAVIGVVALLVGLILSVLGRVRVSAENTQCLSRLRGLGAAGLLCIADQQGDMLDAMYWWKFPKDVSSGSILPYLGYVEGVEETAAESPMSCPTLLRIMGKNAQWDRCYSISIYACGWEYGGGHDTAPFSRHATNLSQIQNPAEMAFFMDGDYLPTGGGVPARTASTSSVGRVWDPAAKSGLFQHPNGKVNVVHLDGHVSSLSLEEFPKGTSEERRRSPFWGSLR